MQPWIRHAIKANQLVFDACDCGSIVINLHLLLQRAIQNYVVSNWVWYNYIYLEFLLITKNQPAKVYRMIWTTLYTMPSYFTRFLFTPKMWGECRYRIIVIFTHFFYGKSFGSSWHKKKNLCTNIFVFSEKSWQYHDFRPETCLKWNSW